MSLLLDYVKFINVGNFLSISLKLSYDGLFSVKKINFLDSRIFLLKISLHFLDFFFQNFHPLHFHRTSPPAHSSSLLSLANLHYNNNGKLFSYIASSAICACMYLIVDIVHSAACKQHSTTHITRKKIKSYDRLLITNCTCTKACVRYGKSPFTYAGGWES